MLKNPNFNALVLVPTDYLRKQWRKTIKNLSLEKNVSIESYDWAVTNYFECDLLICDEVHEIITKTRFGILFKNKYKLFLGLTATINRLDNNEDCLLKHFPICDTVSLKECIENKWVAEFKEYQVLLDVDLMEYNIINEQYNHHFSFFNYEWGYIQGLFTAKGFNYSYASQVARQFNSSSKEVILHGSNVMRLTRKRKEWCYNHPKKIELSKLIIQHRQDKKILTFSQSKKIASLIPYGKIVHSGINKKEIDKVVNEFNKMETGVLNSVQSMIRGCDIPNLSVGIVTSLNSSEIASQQLRGRAIRKEGDKKSEIFNLIIKGTIEQAWFSKGHKNSEYLTIDENQLKQILNNEEIEIRKRKEIDVEFIF